MASCTKLVAVGTICLAVGIVGSYLRSFVTPTEYIDSVCVCVCVCVCAYNTVYMHITTATASCLMYRCINFGLNLINSSG